MTARTDGNESISQTIVRVLKMPLRYIYFKYIYRWIIQRPLLYLCLMTYSNYLNTVLKALVTFSVVFDGLL